MTGLTVGGDVAFPDRPFLCQVAENRAFLGFDVCNCVWYCDILGGTLTVSECDTVTPAEEGFGAPPIRLPDGKLLVAGSWPPSTDITLITPNREPVLEKVGDIPGRARGDVSIVLVKGRFAVGFGGDDGSDLGDLWVFDVRTRRASRVRREGDWRPPGYWAPLVVQGDTLYIVSGVDTTSVNSICFTALSDLILDRRVRHDFCRALGLLFVPPSAYVGMPSQSVVCPLL